MDASKKKELCRMHRWYKKKTGYKNQSKDTTLLIPKIRKNKFANAQKITNAYGYSKEEKNKQLIDRLVK